MKKIRLFAILLAVFALSSAFCSCDGGGGNIEITLPPDTNVSGTQRDDVFCFSVSGLSIAPGDDLTEILPKLGSYQGFEEFENCAGVGKSKFYHYNGFILSTFTEYNTDFCNTIDITEGSSVTTSEGLGVNDTLDKMISLYGNGYTESYGVYTYTKGSTSLLIKVQNNTVTEIEYIAVH